MIGDGYASVLLCVEAQANRTLAECSGHLGISLVVVGHGRADSECQLRLRQESRESCEGVSWHNAAY